MRINSDFGGIACMCLMYFFLFSVDAVVCYLEIVKTKAYLHVVLYNILTFMTIWAYFRSSCADPGFLPKNYKQLDSDLLPLNVTRLIEKTIKDFSSLSNNQALPADFEAPLPSADPAEEATIEQLLKSCRECNALKPPNSHHCRVCNRCVARCDTHCTWINNCVGYYNQRPFIVFLIYLILLCCYAIGVISRTAIHILAPAHKDNKGVPGSLVAIGTFLIKQNSCMGNINHDASIHERLANANRAIHSVARRV